MADSKTTGLTELTAPDKADLLAIVDDVAGTPLLKKMLLANLLINSGLWVIPVVEGVWIQADFTLAAASGVQNCLTAANDTITLLASTTYRFKGKYIMTTGATTHTTAMAFLAAGGLTVTNIEYTTLLYAQAANGIATAQSTKRTSALASTVLNATGILQETIIEFDGIVRVNAGGTIAPQIAFSANPTGTNLMKIGSYIEFWPIGSGTVAEAGPWA